jgi:beta-lactamase regulating signal transducer with metallopeptidase domain
VSEAAFPLLGAAFVVLGVLPICALLAGGALWGLERAGVASPLELLNLRYVVLVSASLLPLAWFLSAGLHQLEAGHAAVECLLDHEAATLCFEPVLFVATLALALVLLSTRSLTAVRGVRASDSERALTVQRRVERIVTERSALRELTRRIAVTEAPAFALGTQGLLRPRVLVGASYADQLDDETLASALGHEAEHTRALDPLRYFALSLALAMNPLGRWLLEPHARRWFAAREACCDREAVLRGAEPLSLANAIIRAARPVSADAVALGARDTAVLKLRIDLLLAFSEQRPEPRHQRGPSAVSIAVVLLALALILPHRTGTDALDALHVGVERAFTDGSP